MSHKKSGRLLACCGGLDRHHLGCAANRCGCGAPATLPPFCGVCYTKAKRRREQAEAEASRAERARICAERIAWLRGRVDD
jgi:hypothetical protein